MGHNSVVSGHSKSTRILRVNGLSTGPLSLGRQNHGTKASIDIDILRLSYILKRVIFFRMQQRQTLGVL